jgi:hypothetical protein
MASLILQTKRVIRKSHDPNSTFPRPFVQKLVKNPTPGSVLAGQQTAVKVMASSHESVADG